MSYRKISVRHSVYLEQKENRIAIHKWIPLETVEPVYDIAGHRTWAKKYKCSDCGFIHTVIEDFGHYRHCPECGERMDIGCENVPVVDMRGGDA